MQLVIIGPPGAGKGTIGERLAGAYRLAHVSTGELLRDAIARGTELGTKAEKFVEAGRLVPQEILGEVVAQELARQKRFVLDGYPRTLEQAEFLARLPGTLFTPTAGQYPLLLKRAHIYFGDRGYPMEVKVWSAAGSVVGSVLASFAVTSEMYPTWTEVDVGGAGLVVRSDNFFISTNDRPGLDLKPLMVCDYPGAFAGHHFISWDDVTWQLQTSYDFSIECTVETNYDIGVAPASLGRVRALFR